MTRPATPGRLGRARAIAAIGTALLVLPLWLWGQEPDLAETAEKAQRQREKVEKKGPVKTFTDEDLAASKNPQKKGEPGQPTATPGSAEAGATPVPAPGDNTEDAARAEESQWRQRARDARSAVRIAEQEVQKQDDLLTQLRGQRLQSTDTNEILRLGAAIEKAQKDQADARAALELAQKALADFENEAHRAGIPPGWVRE